MTEGDADATDTKRKENQEDEVMMDIFFNQKICPSQKLRINVY